MLEFVHFTGADAGKDLQTRRKVRSQAMRDFRRRQRAERDAALRSSPEDREEKLVASHHEPVWESRSRSRSLNSSNGLSKSRSRRPARAISPHSPPCTLTDAFTSISSTSAYPAVSDSHLVGATLAEETSFGPMPVQSVIPESEQSALSWDYSLTSVAPSAWGTDVDDVFQSPAQIRQMLTFCKSYIHWLKPGVDAEYAGKILAEAWDGSQCPMLLAACCLASVGHLDAVQPNRPGGNYEMYKARVLNEISLRMQSPVTAMSNETIGALGLLTSFEMSRCSGEALTHLRGLKSIIKMKGGIDAVSGKRLGVMLETLDLIHAATFDASPVFAGSAEGLGVTPYEESELPDTQISQKFLPLLMAELDEFQSTRTVHSEKLALYADMLASAGEVGKSVIRDTAPTEDLNASNAIGEKFHDQLERFYHLACYDDPQSGDAQFLARVCHTQLVILYNAMVLKLHFRHHKNQQLVRRLYNDFRAIKNDTWKPLCYLRLKILLTGACAARDAGQKSYFKAQLVRAIYQMGMSEWKRVKTFILRFLRLKENVDGPNRRSAAAASEFAAVLKATHLHPGWVDTRRSSTGSALDIPMSYNSAGGPYPSPHLSRSASPLTHSDDSRCPSMFDAGEAGTVDELAIDPFLKYGNFDLDTSDISVPQSEAWSAPEGGFTIDGTSSQLSFEGDCWLAA